MSTTSPPIPVLVEALVVPDGVQIDPKSGKLRLRLNLSLSPSAATEPGLGVNLRKWPSEIAEAVTKLATGSSTASIFATDIDASGTPAERAEGKTLGSRRTRLAVEKVASPTGATAAADGLWCAQFEGTGPSFDDLVGVLKSRVVGPTGQPGSLVGFGSYHSAAIGRFADTLLATAAASTLIGRASVLAGAPAAAAAGALSGSIDPGGATFDASRTSPAFWQMARRQWFDPSGGEASLDALRAKSRQLSERAGSVVTHAAAPRSALDQARQARRTAARSYFSPPPPPPSRGFFAALFGASGVDTAQQQTWLADSARSRRDALSAASDTLRHAALDFGFWQSGAPSSGQLAGMTLGVDADNPVKVEVAHALLAWGLDDPPPPDDDGDDDKPAQAGRKLLGISAYPTLAAYLRFSVDVEVDASTAFGGLPAAGQRRYCALGLQTAPGAPVRWTCAVLAHGAGGWYFGPAPEEELVHGYSEGQLYRDGLLNLGYVDIAGPRFSLRSTSEEQVTRRLIEGASAGNAAALPDRTSYALELCDERHNEAAQALDQRDNNRSVFFCEDLIAGLRPDVLTTIKKEVDRANSRDRWRSLVGRDILFEPTDVDRAFVEAFAASGFGGREDGHVRSLREIVTRGGASDERPSAKLFAWTGESLGAPGLQLMFDQDGNPQPPRFAELGDSDLTVGVTMSAPTGLDAQGCDRRAPPLRTSRRYAVGARLMFANGCGLGLAEARARYADDSRPPILGKRAGTLGTFPYLRYDPVEAPQLLLDPRSPLVLEARSKSVAIRGETLETLVVRDGWQAQAATRRFLTPARSDFDRSEQDGQFDQDEEATPHGAFVAGMVRLELDKVLGTFPIARAGSWVTLNGSTTGNPGRSGNSAQEETRGGVAVLRSRVGRPTVELYPDPWARRLAARFVSGDQAAGPQYDRQRSCLEFWQQHEGPRDARPIVVELRRGSRGQPLRAVIVDDDDEIDIRPVDATGRVPLPRLAIELAPAETIELELWPAAEPKLCAERHGAMVEAIGALAHLVHDGALSLADNPLLRDLVEGDPAARERALGQLLAQAPMRQVQTSRRVRLVHAVAKPLHPPRFIERKDRPELHAVAIRSRPRTADAGPTEQQSWAQYVTANAGEDPLEWKSEPGGTLLFLAGAVMVDRPSTARLRVEARWDECGRGSYRHGQNGWTFEPKHQYGSFAIDDVALSDELRGKSLSLLYEDQASSAAALRALFIRFDDGRARRVRLRLVATSRFTNYFPPVSATDASPYELASSTTDDGDAWLWAPCTERPHPPEIDRIVPLFRWHSERDKDGVTFERHVNLRIYLKTEEWGQSGLGSRLAIVFDDKNPGGCAVDTGDNAPFANVVTRWGADPIHVSGAMPERLSPAAFGGVPLRSRELLTVSIEPDEVTPGTIPTPETRSRDVAILSYLPELDRQEGLYCDVPIAPGPSYFPFVQLGLARHQPHAVENLGLSPAIARWAQVPPSRSGRVTFVGSHALVLELHGVGYHRSMQGGREIADHPLLNVRLMRKMPLAAPFEDAHGRWRPALDREGALVEQLRIVPVHRDDDVWWVVHLDLAYNRTIDHYGLLVEEVELVTRDSLDSSACAADERVIVERGPLFSAIIDLGRIQDE